MGERTMDLFELSGRTAVITGGAGMLGVKHAEAIAESGGIPILADINESLAAEQAARITSEYAVDCIGVKTDITSPDEVRNLRDRLLEEFGHIDILINNAANDPKVHQENDITWSRFEHFSLDIWNQDIAVGLTGAFLCSQILGSEMAKRGKGVILNISSDLGIIAPDQRLYTKPDLPIEKQPVKPVSYSVVKTALIGLTKYLATYWADQGVRANVICPGGVQTDQPKDFISQVKLRIPMNRMAQKDEYKGAVLFLISDASSYMTGATVIIDGGRSCW